MNMKNINKNTQGIAQLLLLAVLVVGAVVAVSLIKNPKDLTQSFAWDCSKYNFNITQDGTVTVLNASSRNEKAQQVTAGVVVGNGTPVAYYFNAPALPAYGVTPTVLGHVDVPSDGIFKWGVKGSLDCLDQGEYTGLSTPSSSPTVTPSPTPTPTPTPTPAACTNFFEFQVK